LTAAVLWAESRPERFSRLLAGSRDNDGFTPEILALIKAYGHGGFALLTRAAGVAITVALKQMA
jgi:hypothetical protein